MNLSLSSPGVFFGRSDPKQQTLRALLALALLSIVMKQTEVTLALCGVILTLTGKPPDNGPQPEPATTPVTHPNPEPMPRMPPETEPLPC